MDSKDFLKKATPAGILITLGIIFGDIGTSPLYVLKAIIGTKNVIDLNVILGGVSCIFWTLTMQTTIKYVVLTLRADNNGEGGIFSLFALVRRHRPWLVYPAIIGGCALLADGIITPPISVSSAVEGLRIYNPDIPTVPIVIAIITMLFLFQQFGTNLVGAAFGPMMFIWFSMIAVLGGIQLLYSPEILKALNPYYAYDLLAHHPSGFWILGSVFLCTTGAEALYSDLGHCGRQNVRVSWTFVKTTLLISYFGQGAWLLKHTGEILGEERNPFVEIMKTSNASDPHHLWFVIPGIIISTAATIIASQSLISGSYTLISEAMRLKLWPKVRVIFPTIQRGQLFVPSVNFMLWLGCVGVMLYFQESSHMEAAYGLSITVTMLMTTILISNYFVIKRYGSFFTWGFLLTYIVIETSFLIANLSKFMHGGWVSLVIGSGLFLVMWVWYKARRIRARYIEFVHVDQYLKLFTDINKDEEIPKFATHLVYLTKANRAKDIETSIVYSIFRKKPKRADVYWLVHVDVQDEPHTMEYEVKTIIPGTLIRVEFKLGFRIDQKINVLFRSVIEDLVRNNEVDISSRYPSLRNNHMAGDFRFVVIDKTLTYDNELNFWNRIVLNVYNFLKTISLSDEQAFGLDTSSVITEKVPLIVTPVRKFNLKRIFRNQQ
ncbi:MAG: KUP/HAK/KT family potassium transporter [Bacteroidota bacterium]